jgi:hypothetical protein
MTVELTEIRFNHDATTSTRSALNIRRDFLTPIPVPEWQPGAVLPDQSVAAYSIADVDVDRLAIGAAFSADDVRSATIQVRTVIGRLQPLPAWLTDGLNSLIFVSVPLYLQVRAYLDLLWSSWQSSRSAVLGTVPPTTVALDATGDSGVVVLPLVDATLDRGGVGAHVVTWSWQYRRSALQAWQTIATTVHKVYTVLQTPTRPWLQQPFIAENTQLPWADVLEVACRWAEGTTDVRDAAERITEGLYGLGGSLEYGCAVGARTMYADPYFNCTAFLDRLAGGIGRGPFVNCSDCATIVSTFANALGADLSQSQMRNAQGPFPVNVIRAIGIAPPQVPCGLGLFAYHEVAWTGRATLDDDVYDACLEVNRYAPLGVPFFDGRLPTGMRFGEVGAGQYRDKLAAPIGRELCQPQPQLATRRPVV